MQFLEKIMLNNRIAPTPARNWRPPAPTPRSWRPPYGYARCGSKGSTRDACPPRTNFLIVFFPKIRDWRPLGNLDPPLHRPRKLSKLFWKNKWSRISEFKYVEMGPRCYIFAGSLFWATQASVVRQ